MQFLREFCISLFRPRIVLFAVFFACYLYAVVDMRLVFQACDELFLWNLRFFTDFIGQPGSLLLWVNGLLVQSCYHGWPGAIVLAVVAWLLLASTDAFMNRLAGTVVTGTWVVPAMFLMVSCSRYDSRMSEIVGLALAMAAAGAWIRIPVRQRWLRVMLFAAISIILYYIAGLAYYCFAVCCVIYEALAEKRRSLGLLLLLTGVAVKFGLDAVLANVDLATWNFHVLTLDRYKTNPLSWFSTLFYCYFPACAMFVVYRQDVQNALKPFLQHFSRRNKAHPSLEHTGKFLGLRWVAGTVFVLLLTATTGLLALDRGFKVFLEMDYYSEHQQWDKVILTVEKLPMRLYSPVVNHFVNLALYHIGYLPYEMFAFPQMQYVLVLPSGVERFGLIRIPCDFLLEVGRINDAEHAALEMMEVCPTGGAVKRLALIKMIKGETDAARLLLDILQDDLVWGDWAKSYLQRLAVDPDMADDEDIQRSRRLMLKGDDFCLTTTIAPGGVVMVDFRTMMLDLMKENGTNRMAFEYLMASYLVDGDLQMVVDSFPFMDRMRYPALPTHYEEAAMIYGLKHPEEIKENGSVVTFRGWKISHFTLDNYQHFRGIMERYPRPNEQARIAIARELEGTYFAYYFAH